MIWESSYWKEPLLASAQWLSRVRLSEKTSDKTYVRIEKAVFLGFYSIRKLLDSRKLSDVTTLLSFKLEWHPNRIQVNQFNWQKLEKLYDTNVLRAETRDIRFLSNLFIHSYIFLTVEGDGRLKGFFVSSDRDRNKKVYFVDLRHVLTAFRTVGRDYPVDVMCSWEPSIADYKTSAK